MGKNKIKKFIKNNPILFSTKYLTLIFIIIVAFLLVGANLIDSRIASLNVNSTINSSPTPTDVPIPTAMSTTPTPIPRQIYIAPAIDPNPIVNCNISSTCGGGTRQMKKSECDQSICCQLGSAWSVYPSRTACTQAQSNYNSNNSGSNYPPCTVYYPALHTFSTYSYTSPETCRQWQNTANTGSTNVIQQPIPVPTKDNSEYNNLLKQLQEACQRVVAEWNTYKENFYANEYNNYSSSAEAIQILEARRQTYQQESYSVGCTQTISL